MAIDSNALQDLASRLTGPGGQDLMDVFSGRTLASVEDQAANQQRDINERLFARGVGNSSLWRDTTATLDKERTKAIADAQLSALAQAAQLAQTEMARTQNQSQFTAGQALQREQMQQQQDMATKQMLYSGLGQLAGGAAGIGASIFGPKLRGMFGSESPQDAYYKLRMQQMAGKDGGVPGAPTVSPIQGGGQGPPPGGGSDSGGMDLASPVAPLSTGGSGFSFPPSFDPISSGGGLDSLAFGGESGGGASFGDSISFGGGGNFDFIDDLGDFGGGGFDFGNSFDFGGGGDFWDIFHEGGRVQGRDPRNPREDVPAVLQEGELVIPRQQASALMRLANR